jgi:hypothetical protein
MLTTAPRELWGTWARTLRCPAALPGGAEEHRRAGGQSRWSLGLFRALTPNAPGSRLYTVTFVAWEAHDDRFIRFDVHEHEAWASDATSARRFACEQVQAIAGYLPAWRIRTVASR